MPDSRPTEEKVAAFRTKYPDRVAALNRIILPLLGMSPRTEITPETLNHIAAPVVDKIITASWGLDA